MNAFYDVNLVRQPPDLLGRSKKTCRVLSLFGGMAKKGQKKMLGQLPAFLPKEHKHFYNIRIEGSDILLIPNTCPIIPC
ncbi:hypothetical protein [Mucilaginibacter pineti]|uniref:hypothetical protein n=1 Tax=Mucilaginibacter pineti TaxID=1391627 RepID=UPI000B29E8F3|nr:hypothetical protein [Mucilaginibacter pineti]